MVQTYNIYQRLRTIVDAYPEKIAVSIDGFDLDYHGLFKHISSCIDILSKHGVGKGDVVALALPNGLDFVVVTIATMAIDAILLPLNPRFKPEELHHYLLMNPPKVVFLPPDLRPIVENMPLQASIFEKLPDITTKSSPTPLQCSDDEVDNPALYMFSSGSTGKSKRITRTQRQIMSEYYSLEKTISLHSSDCILCTVPLYHAHGFGNAMIASLMTGARLVILTQEFSPRATARFMETYGVTIYPAVPFMYKMIVDTRFKTVPNLDKLRLLISAGARLPQDVADSFLRIYGKAICQLYGSTETGAVCINLLHPVEKVSSVGRPLHGMDVSILDESGHQLPAGQEGEIWINSPAMTHQYDDLPEVTSECFIGNRFFAGDLGYLDDEGDLFVTGRKKLMINVAGYKVDPLEIEHVLKSHPAIDDVVVVGVADQHYGELIKAVVVCAPGKVCDEQDLIDHAASQLTEYKIPKIIEFRSEIPYSPLGKVLRKYL